MKMKILVCLKIIYESLLNEQKQLVLIMKCYLKSVFIIMIIAVLLVAPWWHGGAKRL